MTVRLVASRCVLRDWHPPDLSVYREWLRPEHSWHDTNGPYFGRPDDETAERLVRIARDRTEAPTLPTPRESLVIAHRDDDRLIGTVNWYWESRETDWRRIGIVLFDPAVRGLGIGRDALRRWTSYLFDTTDALRLDLATYSGNEAMARAATAAGYVLEARLRRARRWAGGVHDALIYAVLRDEWAVSP